MGGAAPPISRGMSDFYTGRNAGMSITALSTPGWTHFDFILSGSTFSDHSFVTVSCFREIN